MTNSITERTHPDIAKAQKAVSDVVTLLLEKIAALGNAYADAHYQDGFKDGIEYSKQEFTRAIDANREVDAAPVKKSDLSAVEKVAQDHLISLVNATPGLRSSDLASKLTALPTKPAISDDMVRVMISRVKNEGRIINKAGRWYPTGTKSAVPDYQVMQYLPDGSKYLGSDILR